MLQLGCCLPGGSFMPQGEGSVPLCAEEVLLEGAKAVMQAGYDYMEVSAAFLDQLSEEELCRLSQARQEGTLPLTACNSFIPGRFSILDPGMKEALEVYVDKILSRASRLGIGIMVFGSGTARRVPEGMSREDGAGGIREFLRMCGSYGEKYGVTIAVEPLNQRECNILNTVAEGAEMVRILDLPRVRLLADAYHMYCEEEDFSVLVREKELLIHLHVAEPPERVWPGRNGGQYLTRFAAAVREAGYDGGISVECGFQDFFQEVRTAHSFLKEVFA